MKDFYGYERDVKANGYLMSSEFATIAIGGAARIPLVQQVTAQYQHQVTPKFESGSPTLFWLTGQPQGTVSFARLVGQEGFLTSLKALANSCGSLIGVTLGLDGTGGCVGAGSTSATKARFSGAVPDAIQISWAAGSLEVQEGATIRVAMLDAV